MKVKTSSLLSPVECFCEAGVMGGVGTGVHDWKRGIFLQVFFFVLFSKDVYHFVILLNYVSLT